MQTATMDARQVYRRNRSSEQDQARLILVITKDKVVEVDNWGVQAGKKNRSEALRDLIDMGLESASK